MLITFGIIPKRSRRGNPVVLPLVKSVGQEAFLSCALDVDDVSDATWERVGGALPSGATVERGVLKLPSIKRDDEGVYKCTATRNNTVTQSTVQLFVDDFVPVFFGQESLTLDPMTDEELRSMDVVITVNTTGEDGVIFESSRRPSVAGEDPARITRPPNLEHRVRIQNGVLVYEYDIGHGKETITSPNKVEPNNWVTIRLMNNETAAGIQLNSGPFTEKEHPPLQWQPGANTPVVLGAHVEPTDRNTTHDGFKGVISSMTISGQPVDLGNAKRHPSTMSSYDSCSHTLCLHGSRCRNTNNAKGFECVCSKEYTGEYCERRSAYCKNENCNSGICNVFDDTWQCVCPLNATGLRCEEAVTTTIDSLHFDLATSFVAMPRPKQLDVFQLSLVVKPEDIGEDRMLMYVAADYDPNTKKRMSISVVASSIVYSYSDGEGEEELRSIPIHAGQEYIVVLSRNDTLTTLHVNEQIYERKSEKKAFEPGTDLFVGGLPPGLDIPEDVPSTSFSGCISKISVDGIVLDISNHSTFTAGDITPCWRVDQPAPTLSFSTEVPSSTTESPADDIEHIYTIEKDSDAPEPIIPRVEESDEEEVEDDDMNEKMTPMAPTMEEITTTEVIQPELTPTVELSTDNPCTQDALDEACLARACLDHDCGENGECIPFNQSAYKCQCKLYYDGPRCDVFKPIERAAKFDGTAFLEISSDEFPHLTSEKEEIVEFKFKTNESDGVIFWQGQQPGTSVVGEDYFSVGLQDGYLHFSYELGGGAAHMTSRDRVDDDKEHHVRLERQGRRGVLKIDKQLEQRGMSSGILAMLNADGNIFIGGVPHVYRDTGGIHSKNFVGCVTDVSLNGEMLDLMGTAIDGRNVRPCDEWIAPRKWLKSRRRQRSWTIL
ncbi:hypothetical protein Q1695_011446 [Nippostrongylus brasiliensis]|nr:hypothetical protein Q1695_011446 [Nippostrongylus brasiliensis]